MNARTWSFRLFRFAGAVLLTAASVSAWAASTPGTSGGLLLVNATTARSVGLGGAVGTLTDDPAAMLGNPAGLASIKYFKGLFTHQGGVFQDTSEVLNLAAPVPAVGVFGATLIYNTMPDLSDAGLDMPVVQANDKLAQLAFASSGIKELPGLAYGASVKFLSSSLAGYTAGALAVDLGLQWEPAPDALLGLSARNLGTPLKFKDDADPLPLRIDLGGRYYLLAKALEKFFVAADVEQTLESDTIFHFGGEFSYSGVVAVRVGYSAAPGGTDGLSAGVGLQTTIATATVRFDYAYRMVNWSADSFDGSQLFTLGLTF